MLENKTIAITGGTGSFGRMAVEQILKQDPKEIIIFSRDECKQFRMKSEFNDNRLKFIIGNVRDKDSLRNVFKGVDYVFHTAALKQVPSCEMFPIEAVKTNILGTHNVIQECVNQNVKTVVCLSTDKAVYPLNAMGISKAMLEKIVISTSDCVKTTVCCTRYGNVMASRGSVIPTFVEQAKKGKDITVTNPEMTRFMMSLEDSFELVMFAMHHANQGDLFVPKAMACTIQTLAIAIKELFKSNSDIKIIGRRKGEKDHESLLSSEEMAKAIDMGDFYRVPKDLDSSFKKIDEAKTYKSNTSYLMNVEATKRLLINQKYIKSQL